MRYVARLSASLVVLAAIGDAAGAHALAFYALVLAVPAAAAAALAALVFALDRVGESRAAGRAWGHGVALLLILLSAAVRAPARDTGGVPRIAVSALVVLLLLYACQGVLAVAPRRRRRDRSLASLYDF